MILRADELSRIKKSQANGDNKNIRNADHCKEPETGFACGKETGLPEKNDGQASAYDRFKEYEGARYTGMKVGRSHEWYDDQGEWKETKITPDLWEVSYKVTKRRAGRAPKGSGVPVGTAYHWLILAHQDVSKLNANDYSTSLSGFKFKVAYRRAPTGRWSVTAKTQRKRLVTFLKQMIDELQADPVTLNFEFEGKEMKGEAIPVAATASAANSPSHSTMGMPELLRECAADGKWTSRTTGSLSGP